MADILKGGGVLFREALTAYKACVRADARTVKRRSDTPSFNAAETQIMPFILKGASNKEIAARLNMKMTSVKLHVRTLCRKLGASNRTQAALTLHKMLET